MADPSLKAGSPGPFPRRFSLDETLDIGQDTGTPVSKDYDVPFKCNGEIEKAVVTLGDVKAPARP